MPFPSTLSSFNRPISSDRLNNPSHSALHNTVSSAVGQIEQFVGLSTSSAAGTLVYDIRSPDSNGGGHIQTANKGGTGQTVYTKGDLLVATSSSVIAKLAIGTVSGDTLRVDANAATGMAWGSPTGVKLTINTTGGSVVSTNVETQLFAASIAGSILGTNNAIRFTGYLSQLTLNNAVLTLVGKYGNGSIFSMTTSNPAAVATQQGYIQGIIIGADSVTSQKNFGHLYATRGGIGGTASIATAAAYGTSSVQSSAPQELIVTAKWDNTQGSIVGQFFMIERIS